MVEKQLTSPCNVVDFARYSAGQYGETTDEFQSFGKIVEQLADAALAAARRLE